VSLDGGSATFANRNAGAGKTVTLTGATLAGTDAGNYTLTSVDTTQADITALAITGQFTAANKTYDGTTAASVLTRSLTGVVSGDSVSLTGGTATFGNKNVGVGKTVTLTGATLAGADAGNYTLSSVATTTAEVTRLGITGSFDSANKIYDGNTSAAATNRSLTGVLGTDDVHLTGGSASFDDKNVGPGKTVTLFAAGLSGTDAGNYLLTSIATTTADITRLGITGSFTAADKVWDNTTTATITSRSLMGTISGDTVSLAGGTASFADSSVGTWTVTGTLFTLAGADAGNYSLLSVGTTTATITTAFRIQGFFQPAEMTPLSTVRSYNSVKGGQTVPLKFRVYSLSNMEITSVIGLSTKVSSVDCTSGAVDPSLLPTDATGATSLRYTDGQFIFNWDVPKAAGKCYRVTVVTQDGSTVMSGATGTSIQEAYFRSK
jgi:hypothetical protein